ncbi:MAG: four helix bundle protein [Bdellovibrionales bacterium]|jgi:four helix bundle protein|nr:four helix bundle protein [Bdellovibrionales bacterium]MBT3526671.1 four helix bundle protein [Bdellovibrionales bacterium]
MLAKFRTYQLATTFYRKGQKIKMPRHLRDQFDRASSSICLNLAEGSGKETAKDKCRFYHIAKGSLRECQAILELLEDHTLYDLTDHIGASIYRLCQKSGP